MEKENEARGRAAACKQAGCLLREGDFAAYRAKVEEPLTTQYRGIDVYKVSFWSQSPVFLEILNLLEGFNLKSMGHNSGDYIHTVVEAMKLGYADRESHGWPSPLLAEIVRIRPCCRFS